MIWEQLRIEEINIHIGLPAEKGAYPAIFIHSAVEQGEEIASYLKQQQVILVSLTDDRANWQKYMSPWPAKAINKKMMDFGGEADRYIEKLESSLLPQIEDRITQKGYGILEQGIVGYSLGGLFAVYMMTRSSYFQKVASISGSLWYEGFEKYMIRQKAAKKAYWYFSLGNKEAVTKNERMARVESCTEAIVSNLHEKGEEVFYELNEGDHFQDVALRIAKGIDHLLGI